MNKQFTIKFRYKNDNDGDWINDQIKIQAIESYIAKQHAVTQIRELLKPYLLEIKNITLDK